jgi:hypothetical protein
LRALVGVGLELGVVEVESGQNHAEVRDALALLLEKEPEVVAVAIHDADESHGVHEGDHVMEEVAVARNPYPSRLRGA